MTLRQRLLLGGAGLLLAAVALLVRPASTAAAPLGEQLTDAQFTAVRTAVLPADGEDDFAKIPWLTSIWDARIKAAKEGKPILLWEMDGHPLGCG
jgi:hypothetical protein